MMFSGRAARAPRIASWLLPFAALALTTDAHAALCSTAATPVSFGIYNPLSASPNDSTGSVTVTCTGILEVVNYSIFLSKGNGASYTTRYLKNGAQQLNYNLYTASARGPTQIWGDIGDGVTAPLGKATGSFTFVIILTPTTQTSDPFTIFGRIPAGQDVAPGSYTDLITVSVVF